jgi:hypothetical protein
MNIRTIQQVNALGCCPCPFPECTPRKECESLSVTVLSVGFFDDDDTVWKVYKKKTDQQLGTQTPDGTYDITGSSNESYIYTYTEVFDIFVAGCFSEEAEIENTCFTSGTSTLTQGNGSTEVINRTQNTGDTPDESCGWTDYVVYTDRSVTPNVVTNSDYNNVSAGTIYALNATFTNTTIYEEGFTYTEWIAEAGAGIDSKVDFEDEDCTKGTDCNSSNTVDPEPEEAGEAVITMDVVKSRYRFGPPVDFAGSTWEMEWDEMQADDAFWTWFDAGAIGTAPTPGPTLVAHRSWIWNGTDEWSEWFLLPVPSVIGETRVANGLVTCWRSSRIGQKPTAFGSEVALPE